MERVVQELDVVGPHVLGILLEPVHITLERAVGEEAERSGNLDRIVEPARGEIGLPDHGDTRQRSPDEATFHRGERHRLVTADHLGLLIPARKRDENRCDQPDEGARTQIEVRLHRVLSAQRVERSDGGHHERAGHERGHLIVRELDPRPRIQEIGAEARDAQ